MTPMEKHAVVDSSTSHGGIIKEEKNSDHLKRPNDDELHKCGNGSNKDHGDGNSKPSTSERIKDPSAIKHGEELESAKAEMGEVMEENQRLKQYLDKIMKDYQALLMKFNEIGQISKKPKDVITTLPQVKEGINDEDESELVSLSLGRSSSLESKKGINKLSMIKINSSNKGKNDQASGSKSNDIDEPKEKSLALGLMDLMPNSSPDNSFEETMKHGEETWPPSKALKNGDIKSCSGDDEVVQQPPVKKARVSVRARCDTPTMNDGCQWRKYGQKTAKGNPCPRAYYRCTVAPNCPVRKQVQRCADDMSILITTYEGAHNHPLPISATAIASTTSAAAYMLMSGSTTSDQESNPPTTTSRTTTATTGAELHGGGFTFNNNIPYHSKPNPFYFHNSSPFSPTPSHPTITLDLTSTTSSSPTTQFNRIPPSSFGPKYPSTNLAFNSSDNSYNTLPISWPNGLLSYGTHQSYNKTQLSPILYPPHHQDHTTNTLNFQTFLQKGNPNPNPNPNNPPNQPSLVPDTITQAAKVLTSDPSFQSVLTAALSSFINNNNGNVVSSEIVGNNNSLKERESSKNSDFAQKNNTCVSSLLSIAPSTTNNSQAAGKLMFLSPPLPFPGSKSTSSSPGDNRDQPS